MPCHSIHVTPHEPPLIEVVDFIEFYTYYSGSIKLYPKPWHTHSKLSTRWLPGYREKPSRHGKRDGLQGHLGWKSSQRRKSTALLLGNRSVASEGQYNSVFSLRPSTSLGQGTPLSQLGLKNVGGRNYDNRTPKTRCRAASSDKRSAFAGA